MASSAKILGQFPTQVHVSFNLKSNTVSQAKAPTHTTGYGSPQANETSRMSSIGYLLVLSSRLEPTGTFSTLWHSGTLNSKLLPTIIRDPAILGSKQRTQFQVSKTCRLQSGEEPEFLTYYRIIGIESVISRT